MSASAKILSLTLLTGLMSSPAMAIPIPTFSFDVGGSVRADSGTTFDQTSGLDFALEPGDVYNGPGDGGTVMLRNPGTVLTNLGFTDGMTGTAVDVPDGDLVSGMTVNLANFFVFTSPSGQTLTFSLTEITDVARIPASAGVAPKVTFDGTGLLTLPGFDPTTASISLGTTNNGGGDRAAFSSSVASTAVAVPEPVSAALLGTGLLGTALLRFRRRSSQALPG